MLGVTKGGGGGTQGEKQSECRDCAAVRTTPFFGERFRTFSGISAPFFGVRRNSFLKRECIAGAFIDIKSAFDAAWHPAIIVVIGGGGRLKTWALP